MFEQMKQMKALMGALGNPEELRAKMERVQAELEEVRVEGESGAGAVRVVVNGKLKVESVRVEPAMLAGLVSEGAGEEDRELVEELIGAAVNAAMGKAQQAVQAKMAEAAGVGGLGGLDLGGLGGMLK